MPSAIDEGTGRRIPARSLPSGSERPVVEHHLPVQGPPERQVVAACDHHDSSDLVRRFSSVRPGRMAWSSFRSGSSGCIRPLQQCRFCPEPQAGRVPEVRACVRSDPEAGSDLD